MTSPLLIHCIHAACETAGAPALQVLGTGSRRRVEVARRIAWALADANGIPAERIASGAGRPMRTILRALKATRDRRARTLAGVATRLDRREMRMLAEAGARLRQRASRGARSELCATCRGHGCACCGDVGLVWRCDGTMEAA